MYQEPAPVRGTDDPVTSSAAMTPAGCEDLRPGVNTSCRGTHLVTGSAALDEEGEGAAWLRSPSLPVQQGREGCHCSERGSGSHNVTQPRDAAHGNPGRPGSRRQGVPGPRPIHRQGTEQPPEAGSSGFPPPLGVSPGPPRELRFSPTRGTDRHNAESSNTARQRPPSPPRPRPLREQAHQPSEEKGVLQSDVEVPGPAGDDRLLPGLSFPPAVGKVRPNTLRT